jgi:TonB family protein
VIPGAAILAGKLDKDVVRRVVRRHINEVKYCYEHALAVHPELAGRVVVRFTVASTGWVTDSKIVSSTIGSPDVDGCIAIAVRRWEFPGPEGGGEVTVTYPFVLEPASRAPANTP